MDGLDSFRPQNKQECEVQLGRWVTAYNDEELMDDDEESSDGYMPDVEDMYDSEQGAFGEDEQESSYTDNEQDFDTEEEDAAYYMLADDEDEDTITFWSESSEEIQKEEGLEGTDEDVAIVDAML